MKQENGENGLVITPTLRLALLVVGMVAAACSVHAQSFRWVDENGAVVYSDSVPPTDARRERRVINQYGRTIEVIQAPMTPQQIEEEKRLAKLRAEEDRLRQERELRDQTLLATFGTEEELKLARDERLALIDTSLETIRKKLTELRAELIEYEQEAKEYEQAGDAVPEAVVTRSAALRRQISGNEAYIERKEQERAYLLLTFNADLERFRDLMAERRESNPR